MAKTGPDYILTVGKHRGNPLKSIPVGYMTWALGNWEENDFNARALTEIRTVSSRIGVTGESYMTYDFFISYRVARFENGTEFRSEVMVHVDRRRVQSEAHAWHVVRCNWEDAILAERLNNG